jgi:hypothetical protein
LVREAGYIPRLSVTEAVVDLKRKRNFDVTRAIVYGYTARTNTVGRRVPFPGFVAKSQRTDSCAPEPVTGEGNGLLGIAVIQSTAGVTSC